MIEQSDEKQSRREFIRSFGRYLILGGLVSTAGVLITKRLKASAEEKCTEPRICQSCDTFKNCELPQALSAKDMPVG